MRCFRVLDAEEPGRLRDASRASMMVGSRPVCADERTCRWRGGQNSGLVLALVFQFN